MAINKQDLIDKLNDAIKAEKSANDVNSDKVNALEEQVTELMGDTDDSSQELAKFGMEHVDIPASPDDVPYKVISVGENTSAVPEEATPEVEAKEIAENNAPKMRLVNKLDSRPIDEILGKADEFIADEAEDISLSQAMAKAIDEYKRSQLAADQFKQQHKETTDQKSKLTYAVTTLKRTLYGLAARFAQNNVRIEEKTEGLWDISIENADELPEAVDFALKYDIVPKPEAKKIEIITDADAIQWCVKWHPELLVIDARKAEDYIKRLRQLSLMDKKSELLPKESPPFSIQPQIQPTLGKVSYADLTEETIYKIEFERQGDIEPLFKITSSSRNKPLHTALNYGDAKELLAGYTGKEQER